MNDDELRAILARGEDSHHQFKRDFTNADALAAELIATEHGLVVEVAEGLNKPYVDAHGRIWVKNGADKRQVTAREEMQRMFQQSGLVYADQVPVRDVTVADIDLPAFAGYFEHRYQQSIEQTGLPLAQLLENIDLARDGVPNLAGMLLFGKNP